MAMDLTQIILHLNKLHMGVNLELDLMEILEKIYVSLEIQTTLVINGMGIELVDKENFQNIEGTVLIGSLDNIF
jgi:hypothetical protein